MIDDIKIIKIATDCINKVVGGAGFIRKEQRTIEYAYTQSIRLAQECCTANRYDIKVLNKIKEVITKTPIVYPQVNPPEKKDLDIENKV